jgi:hypothetical protein
MKKLLNEALKMRKSIILLTILTVGLLMASTASAMVPHWSDFTYVTTSGASRIVAGRTPVLTTTSAYPFETDQPSSMLGWDFQAPSLASSFSGGGTWGLVTDQEITYDRFEGNTGNLGNDYAVPEPTTMVLLGMGLVGTSLAMRRRRLN